MKEVEGSLSRGKEIKTSKNKNAQKILADAYTNEEHLNDLRNTEAP